MLEGRQMQVLTAAELDARPDEGPRVLVAEPLLIEFGSRLLIHGDANLGKSFLLTEVCVAAAAAGQRVLMLVGEGGTVRTRDRLRGVCAAQGFPLSTLGDRLVCVFSSDTLDSEEGAQQLLDVVAKYEPVFVTADPLAAYFGGDENRANEVRRVLCVLDHLAAQDIAVAIVHHDRKSGASVARDVRGSTALRGWADSVFGLARRKSDVVLSHEKERDGPKLAPRLFRLHFDAEIIRVEIEDAPPDLTAAEPLATDLTVRVLDHLAKGPASETELRQALKRSGGDIKRVVSSLVDRGEIRRRPTTRADASGRTQRTNVWELITKKPLPKA